LELFLQGRKEEIVLKAKRDQKKAVSRLNFEEADQLKNQIEALDYITRPSRPVFDYLSQDLQEIRSRELQELQQRLSLPTLPRRIECYDISNIFGKQAVGSMVVFSDGDADKAEYRRFKIKTVSGISDTAMMREVIGRRLKNDWKLPDLILVDGGRGQLNAALGVIEGSGYVIPVAGLAKRFEEIYLPLRAPTVRLSRQSGALRLLQRLRDEAHRFAITYHRKLRSKEFLTNRNQSATLKK
jgi:excinuclease ABC subunit C